LPLCDAWWDATDSLCRVAGVGRREMVKLEPAGITTLTGLVHATEPAGLNAARFAKLQRQARLQLLRRDTGEPVYEILPAHADSGFALLPDPSPGDLFFDLVGNPFWDPQRSLEYLWGAVDQHDDFTALWAHDHPGEQAAFGAFVDRVHARPIPPPEPVEPK
jgi:uncharacterized protein